MIQFNSVTKSYKNNDVVKSVSLDIEKGESFALLGPNGAGKTTIVKMLMGFAKPNSGTITVNNIPSTDSKSRKEIGFLAENHKIPSYMTGKEYVLCGASFLNLSEKERIDELDRVLELVGMKDKQNDKASTYSKGMVQRIGLAAAIFATPKYLILDEPTSGLDPFGIRDFRKVLEDLNKKGTTIFLNSHQLSEVERCCTSVGIINKGKILVKDSIENIITSEESLEDLFVRYIEDNNE